MSNVQGRDPGQHKKSTETYGVLLTGTLCYRQGCTVYSFVPTTFLFPYGDLNTHWGLSLPCSLCDRVTPYPKTQGLTTFECFKEHQSCMAHFLFIKQKQKRSMKNAVRLLIKKRNRTKDKAVPVMTNNLPVRPELTPDPLHPPRPSCSPDRCRLQWQTPSSTSLPRTFGLSVHTGKEWLSLFTGWRWLQGRNMPWPASFRVTFAGRVLYNARMMSLRGWAGGTLAGGRKVKE